MAERNAVTIRCRLGAFYPVHSVPTQRFAQETRHSVPHGIRGGGGDNAMVEEHRWSRLAAPIVGTTEAAEHPHAAPPKGDIVERSPLQLEWKLNEKSMEKPNMKSDCKSVVNSFI